jgi:hypothetical protein
MSIFWSDDCLGRLANLPHSLEDHRKEVERAREELQYERECLKHEMANDSDEEQYLMNEDEEVTLLKSPQLEVVSVAFCSICPDLQKVKRILHALGFLESHRYTYNSLAIQYHFRSEFGGTVIFLDGKDPFDPEPGTKRAKHAAKFWVYGGAHPAFTWSVMDTLARYFPCTWYDAEPVTPHRALPGPLPVSPLTARQAG